MDRLLVWRLQVLLFSTLSFALAQDTSGSAASTTTSPPLTELTASATSTSSSGNDMPSATDSAPGGSNDSTGKSDSDGLVDYYSIIIVLVLCVVGLGAFVVFRNKRRAIAQHRNGRQDALAQDLTTWYPLRSGRRYWQGRWRPAEVSREEGLNEEGEAPPPYMPKTPDEEARAGESGAGGPAVPLQTLSREDAGLKPPDYSEAHVHPAEVAARGSSANAAGSSHNADQRTDA